MNKINFQKEPSFLQSLQWRNFQELNGREVISYGHDFFIKKPLFFGKHYLYGSKINLDSLNLTKNSSAIFVRFEPKGEEFPIGNLKKTINIQPAKTIILDLKNSEEKLLALMHQKTRYNIRLAEKKRVKIVLDNQRVDDFLLLMKETTKRDKFFSHSGKYYRLMTNFNHDFIRLALAEYEGRVIAAGLFCFNGSTVTYLHGASGDNFRNIMAPYLLQWEMIKLAKKEGYKFYDFYGIDENKWPGVTRFKRGFGGEEVSFVGTFDLVINRFWYILYSLLRIVRRCLKF